MLKNIENYAPQNRVHRATNAIKMFRQAIDAAEGSAGEVASNRKNIAIAYEHCYHANVDIKASRASSSSYLEPLDDLFACLEETALARVLGVDVAKGSDWILGVEGAMKRRLDLVDSEAADVLEWRGVLRIRSRVVSIAGASKWHELEASLERSIGQKLFLLAVSTWGRPRSLEIIVETQAILQGHPALGKKSHRGGRQTS
jgi:hypothetical protein